MLVSSKARKLCNVSCIFLQYTIFQNQVNAAPSQIRICDAVVSRQLDIFVTIVVQYFPGLFR